jgi:hypothetical protein
MPNIRALGMPATLLMLLFWAVSAWAAEPQKVQLLYLGAPSDMAWKGAALGIQEANVLGQYTGHQYALSGQRDPKAVAKILGTRPAAVIAAIDPKFLLPLSDGLAKEHVALLNVGSDHDVVREYCRPSLLHIMPSARMKADGVAQWRKKSDQGDIRAQAWHGDFEKFAGRELNNRFQKLHGVAMDDQAWAGWAAVKMVAETIARTESTDPAEILRYLREEMEFDGQKGQPLNFRETGQLRQPLLIVVDGKLAGEAPVAGVVDSEDLDSLGMTECK